MGYLLPPCQAWCNELQLLHATVIRFFYTFTGTTSMDWLWTQCTLCSLGQRVSFFQSQSNFLWNALQILIFLLYIRFEPASFIGSLAKYQPHYFNLVPPLVSFQSLSLLLIICWKVTFGWILSWNLIIVQIGGFSCTEPSNNQRGTFVQVKTYFVRYFCSGCTWCFYC